MKPVVNSLSTRVALVIALVLGGLMLCVSLWVDRQLTQAIEEEEVEQVKRQASILMASLTTLMLDGSGTLARQWLDNLHGRDGIHDVEVLDTTGRVAFRDTRTLEQVNRYLGYNRFNREAIPSYPEMTWVAPGLIEKAVLGHDIIEHHAGQQMISVVMPVPQRDSCMECHGYDPASHRGVLALTVSSTGALNRIQSMRKNLWVASTVLIVLLCLSLWVVLRHSVLRPINALRDAINRVAGGDRSVQLPEQQHDELGEVAAVFNRMQEALSTSEARIRAVMDTVADPILILDAHGVIEAVNPALEQQFGRSADQIIGRGSAMLIEELPQEAGGADVSPSDHVGAGNSREATGLRADGSRFPLEITMGEMQVAGRPYYVATLRDITDRKAQTAALQYQALHDQLTGLPNRNLLYDRIDQTISLGERQAATFALMIMDLDGFKAINDTLGHHVGDLVLKTVARRVQSVLRKSDTVARLGGDEFLLLLPGTDGVHGCQMAAKILKTLHEPIGADGHSLHVGASIGIALFPDHAAERGGLMQYADVAMYAAKRGRLGCLLYDPAQNLGRLRLRSLMEELREAIGRGQLQLNFQPKVDVRTGRMTGVEALLCWVHPEQGVIYPAEFIAMAEDEGLIHAITPWVIEHALRALKQLDQAAPWPMTLSVNLSTRHLLDPEFPGHLAQLCARSGIPAQRLTLEVSEPAYMAGTVRFTEVLSRIVATGAALSIDDFGTGLTALLRFKKMGVAEIKLDTSVIAMLCKDSDTRAAARAVVALAQELGMRVVAEGVEDAATLDQVREAGCDEAQGYFIAHPMDLATLSNWLRARQAAQGA